MAITINHQSVPLPNKKTEKAVQGSLHLNSFFKSFMNQVKLSELLFFTSQLSLMLEIETPLNLSLKAIGVQIENRYLKKTISTIIDDVEGGGQLSQAMKKHPGIFNSVYTSMVAAGESGGFLKDILDRLVEIFEKRQALVTQLRSVLTYPIVLCVVAVLVIIFIMISVLPKFASLFGSKKDVLPGTTRFLLATSEFLQNYWWLLLILAFGSVIGFMLFKGSKKGKTVIDWVMINFPIVSQLSNKIYVSQFLRILGCLMQSHVPLLEALDVTHGTINNQYFRQLISRIKSHVKEGGKFSEPFSNYPYAPESVKQMVATGEESGNLHKVMLRLAEFYDVEVEKGLKIFASMIEPIALIVMGTVIGLIVSSVVLPLFRLASVMQ